MRLTSFILFILLAHTGTTQLKADQASDSLAPNVYHWQEIKPQQEGDDLKRSIFKGSTTTLSNFDVAAYTEPPGKTAATFKHSDLEELMIVKEGTFKITINKQSRMVGPGSVAFVMPNDEHAMENAGSQPATYYILKYKGKIPDHSRGVAAGGSFILNQDGLKTNNTGKGYRRDFFNRATSQLAQFEMHTTALDKDSVSHAQHTHVQEEIILLLRGNVTMHVADKFYPVSPGDIVFLPSRIPHALLNTGKEQCEYFAFQWRN